MRRGKANLTVMACTVTTLLAFLLGFTYNVVVEAHPSPIPVRLSAAAATVSGVGSVVEESGDASVKPLEMFWETYAVLRQRYRLVDTPGWKDENLLYAGLDGLLRSLGDPYTRFLDPTAYKLMVEQNQGQFQGIGAYLRLSTDRKHVLLAPIANGPAARAGLQRGDILLKIGKVDAVGIDIEKAKDLIRGPAGTTVELIVGRLTDPSKPKSAGNPQQTVRLVVERAVIKPGEVQASAGPPAGHQKDTDIGYIRLEQFNEDSENQIAQALDTLTKKNIKGVILDLRDNPGGLLDVAVGIASRFIEDGPIVYIQENGGSRRALNAARRKLRFTDKPIVVLVNRFSASASEILSGALQDRGVATIVGETTFGKGLVQTIIPLDNTGNGGALKITTAKYFTPNGTDINRKGIKPDIEVIAEHAEQDPFGPASAPKEDAQLSRAVKILREKINRGNNIAKNKAQ